MGIYLNSKKSFALYSNEVKKPYYVDKTEFLEELIPFVETGSEYICVIRPRRFGKTIMANMITSFFGKANDGAIFDHLYISSVPEHEKYLNHYNVISISFSEASDECNSYQDYISRIKRTFTRDLKKAYPDSVDEDLEVWENLNQTFQDTNEKFIFVFDEWDYIFQQDYITEDDREKYIRFLTVLLKDQPYVQFAYMTGILPIGGSELNMFKEYTMATRKRFSRYFGFTDEEVDGLYQKYLTYTKDPSFTRNDLQQWYDGYEILEKNEYLKNIRLYNPRSVVYALTDNQLSSYWTSSGPYDEIFYFVKKNVLDLKDDIAKMVDGQYVEANVNEYASTSVQTKTKDEIISAMVVYGFLTVRDGRFVSIPNKELMDQFVEMIKKENSLGYVYRLAKESDRMLSATKALDTKMMESILQQAHDTEMDMKSYNSESELSAIIRLVYLSARDDYDIQREDKAGTGYVDYIFYPKNNRSDDCIILELKISDTADNAIKQIKDRNYAQRFIGKVGEESPYTGRILAVGISYDSISSDKKHECRVEVLRDAQ